MVTTVELLSKEDCIGLRAELEKFKFADGKSTARGYAKDLKENFQLESTVPEASYIFDQVKNVIFANSELTKYFLPVQFPRMFANYYGGGHRYDWHVDMALMNGFRTDYSFTISLVEPSTYEGGELEMQSQSGEIKKFKLPAGHMVLYPTGQLHRVTEVTSGFRLSIVGWMQSALSSQEDRALNAEFVDLMNYMKEKCDLDWDDQNRFNRFRQKLLRSMLA